MVSFVDKFKNVNYAPAFYWLLQASRLGRYSGASFSALDEDMRDIQESNSPKEAVNKLLSRLRHFDDPITVDDFLRDYVDSKFGRFLLYLLIYQNKALDWEEGSSRIGFEGVEAVFAFFFPMVVFISNQSWHLLSPMFQCFLL